MNEYLARLLALRRRWDVYPWIEVVRRDVPAGSPVGYELTPAFRAPYAVLIREITYSALQANDGAVEVLRFAMQMQSSIGVTVSNRTKIPLHEELLLGDPSMEWSGLGHGILLEEDVELSMPLRLTMAAAEGAETSNGEIALAARGYRLYPAGSIQPPQRTLEEWMAAGKRLDRMPHGVELHVPASTEERYVELQFDHDFVVTSVGLSGAGSFSQVDAPGASPLSHLVDLRIEADRQIMSGMVPRMALVGRAPATRWHFDLPITVRRGTRWRFTGRHLVAPGTPSDLQILLDGYVLS